MATPVRSSRSGLATPGSPAERPEMNNLAMRLPGKNFIMIFMFVSTDVAAKKVHLQARVFGGHALTGLTGAGAPSPFPILSRMPVPAWMFQRITKRCDPRNFTKCVLTANRTMALALRGLQEA